MRIVIDATYLINRFEHRGIGNYTREVIRQFISNYSGEIILLGYYDLKRNLHSLELKESIIGKNNLKFVSLGRIGNSYLFDKRFKFKKALDILQPDLVFYPHFESPVFKGPWKNLLTIHDLIPLETKNFSSGGPIKNLLKARVYKNKLTSALSKADHVLVNSNITRNAVLKYTNYPKERISKLNLGISESKIYKESENKEIRDRNTLLTCGIKPKEEYILYYGGFDKNKGLKGLLEVFARVLEQKPELKLVLVGGGFSKKHRTHEATSTNTKRILRYAKRLGIHKNLITTGHVEDHILPILLRNSKLYVNFSIAEGFGLPVLEAYVNNSHILATELPLYKELYGTEINFVTPSDIESAVDKMLVILASPKSPKYSKKAIYTWEKTYKTIEQVIKKLQGQERISTKQNILKTSNKNPNTYDVVFLAPLFFPFKGGAENYSYNLAKRLALSGKRVAVYTSKHSPLLNNLEIYNKIEIYRFSKIWGGYYFMFYPGLLWKFFRTKANVVHVQGFGFWWQDLLLVLKRFFSRNSAFYINTPHGPFMARDNYSSLAIFVKRTYEAIMRRYLNWLYDLVIEVNPNQFKWITESYNIDFEKIRFIPIGIPDSYPLKSFKSKITKNGKINITYIGRFHEYKGIFDILNAARLLVPDFDNFKINMVGKDAGFLGQLKKELINYRLEDHVEIFENVSDELRDKILEQSEIFILPSKWEAYGISVLEAMAKGNAIVTTPTEGGVYLIKNKVNGLLVKHNSPEDIKRALIQLLTNNKLRAEIIETNLEFAKATTWKEIWPEYEKVYEVD